MLVQHFSPVSANNRFNVAQTKAKSANETSFQPAAAQDLVEIGKGLQEQDRFIDLGPVGKVMYGGAGTVLGAIGGGIAWAAGASGWALPIATVGTGLLGVAIGHFAVDR